MRFQDLRYGVRVLYQNPGFACVAILSLALGIGVNTAIFSLIDAVLLKSLPVKDPQSLVFLSDPGSEGVGIGSQAGDRDLFTHEEFARLRAQNQVFASMFGSESGVNRINFSLGGGSMEEAAGKLVSEDYFATLGIEPAMGRTFSVADSRGPGSDPYLVLSYNYWRKRFALDPGVLGKSVQIHKTFFTIIGVAAPGFLGESASQAPDLFLPMMMEPQVKPGRDWLHDDPSKVEKVEWMHVGGRLKPGISVVQAQSSLNVLFQQILHAQAGSHLSAERERRLADNKIKIRSGAKGASGLRESFSRPLLVLMTVVGLVLLIACANVANLLLARATARRKEIGVRLALGANRARLVGQLVTESMLLALAGGGLGILLAYWGDQTLLNLFAGSDGRERLIVVPDARVLLFTVAVSVVTGVLFGLAPALRATRVDVYGALRENARGVTGGTGRVTAGKVLVAAQVAVSLVLLIGAGLFLRTLYNLKNVDLGYPREKMLLVRVDALDAGYKTSVQRSAVFQTLLERFRAIPGVREVTLSENGLFSGTDSADQVWVEGYKPQKKGDDHARWDHVGPNYFSTIGIPILLGREIGPQDGGAAPRVCVINETMAKFFFGNDNPIGKHVRDEFPDTRVTFEIVGVAKDDRDHRVRGVVPRRFFVPFFNGIGEMPPNANFELRTFADPNLVLSAVRHEVEQVDQTLPIIAASPLDRLLDRAMMQDRLIAQLSTFFGVLALVLAATGLYGVLSYSVARRTNEIGIRMALGARQGTVLGMVFRETARVVLVGIAIGLPLAFAATRLIASQLYGLSAGDPVTIGGAVGVLAAVAMFACYVPARRASRVDPLVALRYE